MMPRLENSPCRGPEVRSFELSKCTTLIKTDTRSLEAKPGYKGYRKVAELTCLEPDDQEKVSDWLRLGTTHARE